MFVNNCCYGGGYSKVLLRFGYSMVKEINFEYIDKIKGEMT